MKAIVAGLLAATSIIAFSAQAATPTKVKIDSGTLVGETVDGVKRFKGVPFAKPPVGDLRWRAPQKISWTGERDATKFALPCPQPINANGTVNGGGVAGATSEDCLYLNVWAPANAKNAPVMMWLYGGAGYLGASHLGSFQGDSFAKNGVIVVTINYRLGMLGNFSHPALTRANAGFNEGYNNYALMDAIAGLEWIRNNIDQFGGDKNNVTLFGQSAGGSMVSSLLSAPPAKGLFHKAIVHSGAALGKGRTLAEGERQGVQLATTLGLPANATVEQLRAIKPDRIVNNTAVRAGVTGILDGKIKTINTVDGFATGGTFDVPLIVGSNDGEGGVDGANRMVNLASKGAPAFQYYFTYVPAWKKAENPNGAIHSAEIAYAFGALDTSTFAGGPKLNDDDRAVAKRMNSCWVAFAKSRVGANSLSCADGFRWAARAPNNEAVAMFGAQPKLADVGPIVTAAANRGQVAAGRAAMAPPAGSTPAAAPARGASAR